MNVNDLKCRVVEVNVKDTLVKYNEYYKVDSDGNEIFDRDVEIMNDQNLYDAYKRINGLLTKDEIVGIRNKYNLTQKEFALILGFGEVTVHRFERGSIQTDSVDAIMRLSENPDNMLFLLLKNRNNVSDELYNSLRNRILELKELKRHALVDISEFDLKVLDFEEESALDIADVIINIYNEKVDEFVRNYDCDGEYITNLKLQKLLYFVQSLSLLVFGKRAFSEKILAWSYGPVVNEVYQKYKVNCDNEIVNVKKKECISSGLLKIINEVVNSYGFIDTGKLAFITHDEEPCKNTKINDEISVSLIKNYFNKVYSV